MSNNVGDDDADLHDLLGTDDHQGAANGIEMTPLNLDQLSEGKLDVPVKRRHADATVLDLGIAYCTYLCDFAPKCCFILGIVAIVIPAYMLVMAVFLNPTEHFGEITNDYHNYADITSRYDFDIKNIDHWCLKGGDDGCRCEDPLQPQSRAQFRTWTKAHEANIDDVNKIVEQGRNIDVAFLGESVIEEMDGRWMGDKTNDNLKRLAKLFTKNFGDRAVALGVAGDTNPSVLWRLLNGEMPKDFNPKIWWLQLGLNDLGRMQCSEEVVVLGILRIVEEILEQKPTAKVVINSLLPMPTLRGGSEVTKSDFKDSFTPPSKGRLRSPRPAQSAARPGNGVSPLPAQTAGGGHRHYRVRHLRIEAKDGGKKNNNKKGNKTTTTDKNNNKKKGNKTKKEEKKEEKKEAKKEKKEEKAAIAAQTGKFGRKPSPKMSSNTYTQKKFTPIVHRERRLPLWTSITAINKELEKFANNHSRVTFFDATDIFAERDGGQGDWVLRTDMISFRGHPTEDGYAEWEKKIAERVNSIIQG